MATSLEKIAALRDEFMGPPGPDADGMELMLRTVVMTGGPLLEQMIPDDPGILDDYLEWMAVKVLGFRSDESEQLRLAHGAPELPPGE